MPAKPVRLARSTSVGGIKGRGIEGARAKVNSLKYQKRKYNNVSVWF